MNMIYIAICEDEEPSLSLIKKRTASLLEEHKIPAKISAYSQSRLLEYDIQE